MNPPIRTNFSMLTAIQITQLMILNSNAMASVCVSTQISVMSLRSVEIPNSFSAFS